MANFYEIKIDQAQLDAVVERLGRYKKKLPTVMRNAVNDTASSARSQIVKTVAKFCKVKSGPIRRRILLKKATTANWAAWLRIKDSPLSLVNFKARQTKTGVSYINSSGQRAVQPRAFIALKNVWVRKKLGGGKVELGESLAGEKLVGRTPIQRLVGPSVAELYSGISGLAGDVMSQAQKRLHRNIDRQIEKVLSKFKVKKAA
jgi:hypothetical protein